MEIQGFLKLTDLEDGMKLLYKGHSKQAKRIAKAQARRFPEIVSKGWHELNHVGDILLDKDLGAIVYEQDGIGKFGSSILTDEYQNAEVYIAVPVQRSFYWQLRAYRSAIKKYAAEDSVLNYSYKSLLNFLYNSLVFKVTGKDKWIWNKEPKGTTCSQASAKLTEAYLDITFGKPWWQVYPCDFASNHQYLLYKLQW